MALTKQTLRVGSAARVLLCLSMAGCSSDGGDGTGGSGGGGSDGSRAEVVASLAENVIVPRQQTFAEAAASFESAMNAAVAGQSSRQDAQQAWRETMAAWQPLEVMQLGPAGSRADVMGGQSLRTLIYDWPNTSPCVVDRQTAGGDYDDPEAIASTPGSPVDLWTIEYLLFTEDPDNQCSALDSLNSEGIWDGLGDEVPERRLTHAASLASLVRQSADDLETAWAPDGGNFVAEFTGQGAVYGSAQEALNAISDAMFYLPKEAKDMKIGKPAGLQDCAPTEQPCELESRWAFVGRENLVANLRGFQELFLGAAPGTEAPGFDDLLIEMGSEAVASDVEAAIEEAIASTEALPGTLADAIANAPEATEDAFDAIDRVSSLFETEVLSTLDLEIPNRAAGDND